MAQRMAAEVRKQHRITASFCQHLIIAVTDNPAKSFIQRSLMLRITKAVDEDEIRIPVNRCITSDTGFKLPPPFFCKSLPHRIQHRNPANTTSRFRGMDIAVATIGFMVVVDQRVVYINHTLFHIDVTPA